jgi:hypothetical protein
VEKAGIEPARQRLQGATAAIAAIPDSGPTTQDLNREPPGTDGRPRWARGRMWDASRSAPVHPGRSWNRTTRNRITSTASTRPRDTMRWHRWNWRGLNPRPLRCKRSALPSELQPRCLGCPGPRRGTRSVRPSRAHVAASCPGLLCMMLTLWSCQRAGTFTRRWCSQGRTESNCHSAGFGDRIPSRWVIPMRAEIRSPNRTRDEYISDQLKTARGDFSPAGGSWRLPW